MRRASLGDFGCTGATRFIVTVDTMVVWTWWALTAVQRDLWGILADVPAGLFVLTFPDQFADTLIICALPIFGARLRHSVP